MEDGGAPAAPGLVARFATTVSYDDASRTTAPASFFQLTYGDLRFDAADFVYRPDGPFNQFIFGSECIGVGCFRDVPVGFLLFVPERPSPREFFFLELLLADGSVIRSGAGTLFVDGVLVPLPAALPLLAAGVGLLGLMRRRTTARDRFALGASR